MSNLDSTVSLTAEEALQKTQAELNSAMIEFDRWISSSPGEAVASNVEYRVKQQQIKLLRLRMRELEQMRDDFANTLMILSSSGNGYTDPDTPCAFTKKRTGQITYGRNVNKLGARNCNKVAL